MNFLAVALVYAGLLTAFVGILSFIKPPRKRALRRLTAGLAMFAVGILLPAGETRVPVQRTHLDEFSPVYQFSESHSVRVHASREQVYAAIWAVTPDEIALFQAFTWIRRFGKAGKPNIINAPGGAPLLNTAIKSGFHVLAEEPGKEIVVATVMGRPSALQHWAERFKTIDAPNVAKIAMNFRVEELSAGECELFTETRVYATNASGRRVFAGYWRIIYPGSALIRRMWLRAIRLRAEAANTVTAFR